MRSWWRYIAVFGLVFGAGIFLVKMRSRSTVSSPAMSVPLKTASAAVGESISVAVNVQNTCELGDLDAIALALHHDPSAPLLFSLEGLSSQSPAAQRQKRSVSFGDLEKGFVQTFALPKSAGEMGVFLCKDSSLSGQCSGKSALHASAVVAEDTLSAREAGFRSPDRIYAFQPLSASPGKVEWAIEGIAPNDTLTPRLGRFPFSFRQDHFELVLTQRALTGCP